MEKSFQMTGIFSMILQVILLCLAVSAPFAAGAATEIRINAGGGQYTDGSSNVWSADTGFNTGFAGSPLIPIAGTSDQPLFDNNRYDLSPLPELMYSLAVPNGDYTVKLYFAETFAPNYATGQRLFDVKLEGGLVWDNLDVFAEAGAATMLVKQSAVTVVDGQLNIEFLHEAGNNKAPIISAIELIGPPAVPDTEAPTVPASLTATAISADQINLNWVASTDVGGGTVAGYKIFRDGGATEIATVTGTSYSDTGLTINTMYNYTVTAFDNASPANESLPSNVASATTLAVAATTLRINAGGGQYTDGSGNVWSADTGFNTGFVGSPQIAIAGTSDQPLFDNNRYDLSPLPELMYSLAVPNGDYTVKLYFAETFAPNYATGQRLFDVKLEGGLVWDNLDVFAEAGAATMLVKQSAVTVVDGQLNIEFLHEAGNNKAPIISAIELIGPPAVPDTEAPTVPASLIATAISADQINLNWVASTDVGGGTVAGYKIFRDGGATEIATVTGTSYSDTGLTINTMYNYTVTAFDNASPANESLPSNVASATTLAVAATTLRINAGGGQYTDGSGNVWSADTGFNTGFVGSPQIAIAGTSDQPLFDNNRYDLSPLPELMYSLAVPNGDYTVKLYFAETFAPNYATGQRLFDVKLEGGLVWDNLDVFAEAGAATMLVKQSAVTVVDGQLNIEFLHEAGNNKAPIISAIELIGSPAVPDTEAPTVPASLIATAISADQINLNWVASTDVGGGTVAGYKIFRDGGVTEIATVTGTSYSDTGLTINTMYNYTVTAFDNASPANESLPSNVASATTLAVAATTFRINAGGGQYTDGSGNVWSADTGFNTGFAGSPLIPIAGTSDQPLFDNNRFDLSPLPELMYSFAVPNGDYTVKLYFAETFAPNYATGQRLFDVKLEGGLVWDNLDVFAEAGAATMLVKQSAVTVVDGQMNIEFLHEASNNKAPLISAIELVSVPPAVVAPVINPNGGIYLGSKTVTLSTPTSGAQIYYTTNGTDPTLSSTLYIGPFTLVADAQVNARAFKDADISGLSSAFFTILSAVSYDFTVDNSSDWTIVDDSTGVSNWNVVNGEFVQTNERGIVFNGGPTDASSSFDGTYHLGTYAYLGSGLTLTDYRVSLDMTPIPDTSWYSVETGHDIGIMFRYTNINNYYRLSINASYGFARLEKKVGGVFTTLAVDDRGYQAENQLINVSIEVNDDLIQVYVDGEARFAVRDTSLSSGSVALYTQDGAKFDNIVIGANSSAPSIVIADPLAYSVATGNQLNVSAVAMNIPPAGSVEFDIDGASCAPVVEASPGYFTATCSVVNAGEHTVTAILKEDASPVASDINIKVGTSGDVYLALGDSITNGLFDKYESDNGPSVDGKIISVKGFESLLHDLLNASQVAPQMVHNEGISGDTSDKLLNLRILSILERRIDANKALVMLGTNDSGGSTPIPSGYDSGTDLWCQGVACNGTYKGNMQAIIDLLNASGVTPVIALPPPNLTMADALNSSRNALIEEYNTAIKTQLTGHVVGPDFYGYFLSATENRYGLFENVHPNGLGHVIMSELWHHYLTGNTALPSRSQLSFVLEGMCVRLTSATCVDPMEYKQNFLEADGDPYYVDETYSLTTIPSILDGGIWLSTANADQSNTRSDYLTFNVDRNVDVYIAYDPAASALPTWMAGFTDTLQTVSVTDPGSSTLNLYHKSYIVGVDTPVDGTIQLGGNLAAGASGSSRNYIVIVKEQ